MANIIAIASAKGGVGKSTTVINLASALHSFSRQVIIADCNLKKPNIGLYLGYTHTPHSMHSTLRGHSKVHEALYLHPSGLTVIPGNLSLDELEHTYTTRQIENVFSDLFSRAEIVLVDTPPDVDDDLRLSLHSCSSVILVTTLDLASVTDTHKTLLVAQNMGKKVLGVVATKVRESHHDISLADLQATLGVPVIGAIPYDDNIRQAQTIRHPAVYVHPESAASVAYKKLAANLIGQQYEPALKSGSRNFVSYILARIGIIQGK
ncbi:MAG TPA: P-loop NTPase [Acidobacteriota bacterium]|nr:P-loop NTPase [Acidobacteriota bacterium]